MVAKKGYCEVCGNEYSNIHQHKRTKKHFENMENAKHETEPQNAKEETAQEAQELEQGNEILDAGSSNSIDAQGVEQETTTTNGKPANAGAEKAKLPEKKHLPEVTEDKSATIRIVDEAQEKSGKGLMDSINEMLTPEVKTALGALIAGAVAIGMQKIEQVGKPEEKKENIYHDLHGGAHEW